MMPLTNVVVTFIVPWKSLSGSKYWCTHQIIAESYRSPGRVAKSTRRHRQRRASRAARNAPATALTLLRRVSAAVVLIAAAAAAASLAGALPEDTVSAQEPDRAVPGTPSQVTVTRADGALQASWPAVDGATSYHITYSSDGKRSWSLAALHHPGSSITIGGVDNGSTYVVGVRARNAAGDSGWRNSAPAGPFAPPKRTPAPTPTPTPTPTPEPALSFGGAAVADQSWTAGTAIDALTLPAATRSEDGASTTVGVITYALSPDLPTGLGFDAVARTVSGTPTAAAAAATYTYSATYGDDTAELQFRIEVTEGLASGEQVQAQAGLSWVTTPQHQNWQQGVAVNVQLPAATGADHIVYSLVNSGQSTKLDLPPGLSWNASTRTISGTPTGDFSKKVFVYNAAATNKGTHSNLRFQVADTNGNYPPYANIKSNDAQLLAQLWSHYHTNPGMSCYSGSITFAPSSGHSVHFVDDDGDTMTFTAGSSDMVSTTINSSGYAVMTLKHPPIDWYFVHYTATDPSGLTDSIQLGVKSFSCTHGLSVQENKPKDTVVGSVGGSNPGGSSFMLTGDANTYFDIDSSTGQVTVKDGTTLDYETKTQYAGTFRYTVAGKTAGGDIRINVSDVRAPNVDRPTLAQNAANPTTALDVSWTAPTPMTGTTINDYDVRYREWGTSTWTEMPDTTNSTATSTTITGLTAGKEYEVQVRSQIADEGPGHWSGSSLILYLAENTAANGNVGGKFNVNATDYYPLQFTLGGTDGSKFKLSTDTGYKTAQSAQIQVKTGNVPNYEAKTSYTLTLRAVENNLQRNILDVTYSVLVVVTDVSEPPGKPTVTVARNSTTPTTKLDVSWTAPTMTGKPAISDYDVQYRKTGDSSWTSHSFTGTGTSTTLTPLTAGKKYDVQVRATNAEGTGSWSDTGTAITRSTAVTRSVAENTAANGHVGAAVTMTAGSYTLAHSLDGTDKDKFTIGSTTGQIQVKTGNIPDYESTTSYSVTVQIAVSGTGNSNSVPNGTGTYTVPVTINVTDVTEPPPKLAGPTVTANSITPSTKLDVSWTAPTNAQMSGKPAVSDYDVQYRQAGASDWTDASFTGTGTSTTLSSLTTGKSYEVQVRASNAEGNGAWSDSGRAITDANAVTRSVAENSAAGTNVGAAVTATSNTNGYALTHALSGTDASKFEVGSTTGQITVKSGTSLDYETKTSYSVTVTVTAAVAQVQSFTLDPNAPGDYTVPVTITVTDVNEPPTFSGDTATRSVAENSGAGTNIGAAVTATDPDGGATFSTLAYSLTGTDASTFDINSSTGQITVKAGNVPDYEAKTSYSVTVNVTDGKNGSGSADTTIDDTIAVTITVTDVSEPPPAPAAPTVTAHSTTPASKLDVSWTAPTMTGKPAITDYDVQYRQAGDSTWTDASFTGTTTSTTLSGLTAGKTYEVQVRASNDEGDGAWSPSGSAVTKASGVTRSIDENSDAGSSVGAAVTASNTSYTYSHSLSGTDASTFDLNSSTGQITVKAGHIPNYEAKTSYSVVVTVTAAAKSQGANAQSLDPNAPGAYVVPVTITVTDVAEPPDAPATPEVTQNTATPKTKLDVSWTAPVMTGKPAITGYDVRYKKGDDSTWTSHSFTGTGTSTTLTGLEEGTDYDVQVQATNDEGDSGWSDSGTANTQDKNVHAEFPDQTATRSIAENSSAGTNVGAAVAAEDTENHTLYYSLAGTDGESFDIGLNSGQITVKAGSIPNYEAKTSYSVTVEVSDRKDTNDDPDTKVDDTIAVTITVTDVNEPPAAPTISVAANSTTPTTKVDVSWTAPGMAGKPAISDYDVQYRQAGDSTWSSHSFTGTGTSTTLSGLTTGKTYEVQVRAVNAEGNGAWSASGTAITDANAVSRSVAENSAAGTAVGAAVTATQNPGNYTLTHSLGGTDASSFTIESSSGQIQVQADLDYETKKSYSVVVTVSAAAAGVQAESFSLEPNAPGDYVVPVTIKVTDVNDKPTFPGLFGQTRSIAENSAAGSDVGAPVEATDQDGDTLTYSLTGTDADKFEIDSGTGQITVGSGTSLDYEAKTGYLVTVQVTDGKDKDGEEDTAIDASALVNITVQDVNEPPAAPAAPAVSENAGAPTSKLDVSWTAPVMTGKPAVTDYDVRYRLSGGSSWTSHSFTGAGTSTTLPGLTDGKSYEVQVRASNHEGRSGWSASGAAITRAKTITRSVQENSTPDTNVGAPTSSNPNNYTLSHALGGTDAGMFEIDSSTGQITVADGTTLDFEAQASYSVTVTVTATQGGSGSGAAVQASGAGAASLTATLTPNGPGTYVLPVDIGVDDMKEPLGRPGTPTSKGATTTSILATWTAPDATGKPPVLKYWVRYWEQGENTYVNTWTVYTNEALLDEIPDAQSPSRPLKPGTAYLVKVMAENDEGYGEWSATATLHTTQVFSSPAPVPAPAPTPTATPRPAAPPTPPPAPAATPPPVGPATLSPSTDAAVAAPGSDDPPTPTPPRTGHGPASRDVDPSPAHAGGLAPAAAPATGAASPAPGAGGPPSAGSWAVLAVLSAVIALRILLVRQRRRSRPGGSRPRGSRGA